MKENRLRSLIKGITWRMLGTLDTIVISYILTGKIKVALSIGGVELFSKIALYYFHERVWEKINFGKEKEKEKEKK
jgi:uncharacterized membrane protein